LLNGDLWPVTQVVHKSLHTKVPCPDPSGSAGEDMHVEDAAGRQNIAARPAITPNSLITLLNVLVDLRHSGAVTSLTVMPHKTKILVEVVNTFSSFRFPDLSQLI